MVRRGWGEGSICRRTVRRNGKEYFYWRAVLPAGAFGSRREKQGRNEREVRAWLRDNSHRGLPARNGMTLGAYAVDWLKETSGNVKPATTEFWRLTPTGYASEDPTTRAAWMVQGETDAGPQRRCVACRQWWPLEKDHWVRRPRARGRTGYIQPCKACRVENGLADS